MKKPIEYKIGEVATLLGIKTSVLRYWEKEFPYIVPNRTDKKHRVYTEESLERIKVIYNLLYKERMTIEGAKRLLANTLLNDENIMIGKEQMQSQESIAESLKSMKEEPSFMQEHNVQSIIEELEDLRNLLNVYKNDSIK